MLRHALGAKRLVEGAPIPTPLLSIVHQNKYGVTKPRSKAHNQHVPSCVLIMKDGVTYSCVMTPLGLSEYTEEPLSASCRNAF